MIDKEPYVCKINEDSILYIKHKLKLLVPFLSKYVNSTQLTLCTLLWSFLIVLSGYLARTNRLWLLLSIISLIGHLITDLLDGEMSIYQNDGLEKWNFFMDHLLDFILTIAVFIGLVLMFYKKNTPLLFPIFFIFALTIINMAASFLLVAEKGLDLGVQLNNCFTFNIFHMHLILIIFYIVNIIFKKRIKALYIYPLVVLIGLITIYNIYKKQEDLIM
jgi:phosphatidylglycerophosphate synthase